MGQGAARAGSDCTLLADEATALDALPKFPSAFDAPAAKEATLKATGTDGKAGENVLPVCLPESTAQRDISIHRVAPSRGVKGATTDQTKTPRNPANAANSEASEAERGRFELPSHLHGCRFSRPVQSTTLPPLPGEPRCWNRRIRGAVSSQAPSGIAFQEHKSPGCCLSRGSFASRSAALLTVPTC